MDFRNASLVTKSLKCLANFINLEYSGKPWNRYSHFSNFIHPKQNYSLSLKDHQSNRIKDCALATLYHMDDIASNFDQLSNIINSTATPDGGFLEIEVLQLIYAAISLVGLHILKPFHDLILGKDTTMYSTLLNSFLKLYEVLNSTSPKDILTFQVFNFSKPEHFKNALPNSDLSKNLINVAKEYSHEVCQLISLLLKKFAYGFDYQKGAILALVKNMSDDTGIVLKLCDLDDEKINQLNQVQIHNLSEEGSDIFGKQNLKHVSCKVILNNSADLKIKNLSDKSIKKV